MENSNLLLTRLNFPNLNNNLSSYIKTKLWNPPLYSDTFVVNHNRPFPLTKKYFGVEVEVERCSNSKIPPSILDFWRVENDGSLRNGGVEFVSSPLYGTPGIHAIELLYDQLNKIAATVSPRCSLHVHVNMRDSTWENLINLVLIYLVFERVLYDFVGNERDKNNFCIPLYSYPLTHSFLHDLFRLRLNSMVSWSRYTGLNLAPLTKGNNSKSGYGTIEFRHFAGSRDVDKVLTWISIILQMVKKSEEYTFQDLVNLLTNKTAEYVTHKIFEDYSYLFKDKPLQEMIEEGQQDLWIALYNVNNEKIVVKETSDLYIYGRLL